MAHRKTTNQNPLPASWLKMANRVHVLDSMACAFRIANELGRPPKFSFNPRNMADILDLCIDDIEDGGVKVGRVSIKLAAKLKAGQS